MLSVYDSGITSRRHLRQAPAAVVKRKMRGSQPTIGHVASQTDLRAVAPPVVGHHGTGAHAVQFHSYGEPFYGRWPSSSPRRFNKAICSR